MELEDTVELMISDDYTERFKAEYYQLKIRCEALRKFINKTKVSHYYRYYDVPDNYGCSEDLFEEQLEAMENYLDLLQQRAFAQGIEI